MDEEKGDYQISWDEDEFVESLTKLWDCELERLRQLRCESGVTPSSSLNNGGIDLSHIPGDRPRNDSQLKASEVRKRTSAETHIRQANQPKISATFSCDICAATFTRRANMKRHISTTHTKSSFSCDVCQASFRRTDKLDRHIRTHRPDSAHFTRIQHAVEQIGSGQNVSTDVQVYPIPSTSTVQDPTPSTSTVQDPAPSTSDEARHSTSSSSGHTDSCDYQQTALHDALKVHTIRPVGSAKADPLVLFMQYYEQVNSLLKSGLKSTGSMKFYIAIKCSFTKGEGENMQTTQPYFRGICHIILKEEDVQNAIYESWKKIHETFVEYTRQGSNWQLDEILQLNVHIAQYQPLRGSSYIPLPSKLHLKHAIVNVFNTLDEDCFKWSILAALHPVAKNSQRVSKYRSYEHELHFGDIDFPVKPGDIPKFEKLNQISVNLFGYADDEVFPIHITRKRCDTHVNLLLIADDKTSHYCWIKDFNKLLFDQNRSNRRKHFCPYCLHGFIREDLLKDHLPYCQIHGPQKIELPKEADKWLQFTDVAKQLKVPYIIYADFESLLEKIDSCSPDPMNSYTQKRAHHAASGFAYKVVGLTDDMTRPLVVYRGEDARQKFVEHMLKEQEKIDSFYDNPRPIQMTRHDWRAFNGAKLCHICGEELGDDRVRDHCHATDIFRAAAHNECNINYKFKKRIPVVFHGLKNYDSHIIMQVIGQIKDKPLKCIPNNMEKYISFSMGNMDFIDSFQFMSASLEKLVENLAKEGSAKFLHLSQYVNGELLPLLLRKGVNPYDYVTSAEVFEEKELPPKEAFFNNLTQEPLPKEDYEHAHTVWTRFRIENIGEYHDLYLASDVLLLTDVFENFRDICLNYYELDPAHFYTSPGLAWQACLKMTRVRLELLTDIDMHLFVEKGVRGGISVISHRHAKANNPSLPGYRPEEPTQYLMYLDMNNLYGWTMSETFPTHGFHWLSPER